MKILDNEPLANYTTFKLGGNALKMYFPENREDLSELYRQGVSFDYLIGGGSNLLINDQKDFQEVINLRKLNTDIVSMGDGKYCVGAGVRLQQLINSINHDGYGGIEYLFSVPGLVGGALYMNAGRGRKYAQNIGDYLISVDYFSDGQIHTITKDECRLDYRFSVFQEMTGVIILSALFQFKPVDRSESQKLIEERKALCKRVQDMSAPNFGTVFRKANKWIIQAVRFLHPGYRDGVRYSSKTTNWLLRGEKGTFKQAIELINRVKKMHKALGRPCSVEVVIWE